ncbi:MAG: carbohydrate ABC transporter permease [Cyanobacteria bacterium J06554_6]
MTERPHQLMANPIPHSSPIPDGRLGPGLLGTGLLWIAAAGVLLPAAEVVHVALSGPVRAHLQTIWQQAELTRALGNTLLVAITVTGLQLATASLGGYALARLQFRGRQPILIGVVATLVVPFQVLVVPIFLILKAGHQINTYGALIWPTAASGYSLYLMYQCFRALPTDLEAASTLDGANRWQTFWYVLLPLTRPTLLALFLLTFIGEWNDLFKPLVFTTQPELQTLQLALASLQQQFTTDWSLQMTAVVVVTLPVLLLFLLTQRYFVRGIATTGLKE